jgi:hypothetical protein
MERRKSLPLVLLLSTATLVRAQPIPAGMKVGLPLYLQAGYSGVKQELLEAADDMPADDYGFKPGAAGEMRTYGQVLLHVAESQFGTCASLKGVANPREGRSLERELTAKTDVIKALSESFALCDDVFGTLTDASGAEFTKVGQGEVVRSAVIAGLLAHDSEMYGIATVYLRARNLVPPSTRRQMQQRSAQPK